MTRVMIVLCLNLRNKDSLKEIAIKPNDMHSFKSLLMGYKILF